MLATYSGTKAFLATFTSALAEEVRKDNIVVEHVNTYFVVCASWSVHWYCVFTPLAGLQALQDPEIVRACPYSQDVRSVCVVQDWLAVWRGIQRETQYVYAVLVARAAELDNYAGWDAGPVYLVHAQSAQGHPGSCAAQGGEEGSVVFVHVCRECDCSVF